MNLSVIQNCNRAEKVAILKLIIKIASADGSINEKEQHSIEEFLDISHLKTSSSFIASILDEDVGEIVSAFKSKSNLRAASKLIEEYAEQHSIHPELEGKVLERVATEIELKKKEIKFSLFSVIKSFCGEFKTLWGQESTHPEMKAAWAFIFTIAACVLGSFITEYPLLGIGGYLGMEPIGTDTIAPNFPAVFIGLLAYGALTYRGYLPSPTNFRNVLFFIADVYLLSILARIAIGEDPLEQMNSLMVVGSIVLLLWLGIKEILGFVLLFAFTLVIAQLVTAGLDFGWRAFPFIIAGFLGLIFQSKGLFSDFSSISNSFFRTPDLDKELIKESIESAGTTIGSATKVATVAISSGGASATGAVVNLAKKAL